MKNRKIISLLLAVVMAFSIAACSSKVEDTPAATEPAATTASADTATTASADTATENSESETENEAADNEANSVHSDFSKVTDYLYEVTYDGYEANFEQAKENQRKYIPAAGGCSSVQNGYIRGRNYDWTLDEEPEFVIHVPAAQGRHASVGVAATTAITAEDVENKIRSGVLQYFTGGDGFDVEEEEIYGILPYFTLDGINDAGLTVNVNVVNFGEKGEFVMKTEDTSDDICPLMIPRLMLDQAGSIDEALALIQDMDIFSLGTEEECHYMISGPQSADDDTFNTIVLELIPDAEHHYQFSVIDYNKGEFVDNKPIMTNFHLTGFDGSVESLTRHPMGYERYRILSNAYGQGATVNGMKNLMKKVYYTKFYDLYSDNYWYSELSSGDLTMANVGEPVLNGDISRAGAYAEKVAEDMETFENSSRTSEKKVWHTVHTSVYDCANKTLSVLPQEAGFSYDFTIE